MPRRVNRHLNTPPLPQRAGIDPTSLKLPEHPEGNPASVADYLIARFSAHNPQVILDCFARQEVRTDDGRILNAQSPYVAGEKIWYYRELPEEAPLPDDMPILYEDEHVLAVDKPHYLPVTPRGAYVAQTALTKLRVRENNPLLTPVHRLDRATAGIVLFAKTRDARAPFQMLFQRRQVTKTYLAIAPAPAPQTRASHTQETLRERLLHEGTQVCTRIEKERGNLQVRQYTPAECERLNLTVNAQTLVRIRETFAAAAEGITKPGEQHNPHLVRPAEGDELALYELTPHTGKMHQLRAHMNLLGTPIFGDVLYPHVLPPAEDDAHLPLQLVAHRLEFMHPLTHEPITLHSERSLALIPRNVLSSTPPTCDNVVAPRRLRQYRR